ncbi:MAG: preprotein translocase subunit SecY [Holosporales bacterium]|jgi:preprotein translocase subunit SecY|nr:preprotein translocase subunit SecY [Holosporales bacterium]
MAFSNDSLAQGINWASFSQATDLKKRLLFTVLALLVYRVGTYVPLPGVNPEIISEIGRRNMGGILGMFDMFSGGALGRMTIFALNIVPYISASIIIQLFTVISPTFEALKKEGEIGRRKLNQYTRYLTVGIASIQAYGLSIGLMSMSSGSQAVTTIGALFSIISVPTLVGGTVFLMWLGEQITSRGIGNGSSLIIFAGIVANLPRSLLNALELGKSGALSPGVIVFFVFVVVCVITLVVFVERAQRKITVHYPQRHMAVGKSNTESSHLPLKINTSGVIPPIFASSLLLLPATLVGLGAGSGAEWAQALARYLSHGHPLYISVYVGLLVFFSFFYTAIVFNPDDVADNLRKSGGFVPGIRPGEHTAKYLYFVLERLTVVGAIYLSFICILPELLIAKLAVPFFFGGTNILIVVSVTIDTISQIYTHLLAYQYKGVLRKAKSRGVIKP